MIFRWEEDLRTSFEQRADPSLWAKAQWDHSSTARESTCSEGRADLVWAGAAQGWPGGLPQSRATLLQQPTCSRILSMLKPHTPRREAFLLDRIGVSTRTLRHWIRELEEGCLISDLGGKRFVLGPAFSPPEIEICAFEFKLDNWRRALYQATRYRTFAHRVYVVMPTDSAARALAARELFRRLNVGLLSHDGDGRTRMIIPSSKRRPTSRYRFIMALGMFLDPDCSFTAGR